MTKKSQGPAWFKLWLHHRPLIDAVPDDVAGRVLKAALNYLATGRIMPLEQLEMVVFSAIKADIDDAQADYMQDVENGKRGGRPKKNGKEKPPVREGYPPLPTVREGDGEGERDGEEEGDVLKADKPPIRPGFSPPTVEEVKQYCREKGYCLDAERFADYYESNGWMVGKNRMKDWKAAVRNWNRKEKVNNGKTGCEHVWSGIGTVV